MDESFETSGTSKEIFSSLKPAKTSIFFIFECVQPTETGEVEVWSGENFMIVWCLEEGSEPWDTYSTLVFIWYMNSNIAFDNIWITQGYEVLTFDIIFAQTELNL